MKSIKTLVLIGSFLLTGVAFADDYLKELVNRTYTQYNELRKAIETEVNPELRNYLVDLEKPLLDAQAAVTSLESYLGTWTGIRNNLGVDALRASVVVNLLLDASLGKAVNSSGSDFGKPNRPQTSQKVLSHEEALEAIKDAADRLSEVRDDMRDELKRLESKWSDRSRIVRIWSDYVQKTEQMVGLVNQLHVVLGRQISDVQREIGRASVESAVVFQNVNEAFGHIEKAKVELAKAKELLERALSTGRK